jgi:hypothetical protein
MKQLEWSQSISSLLCSTPSCQFRLNDMSSRVLLIWQESCNVASACPPHLLSRVQSSGRVTVDLEVESEKPKNFSRAMQHCLLAVDRARE